MLSYLKKFGDGHLAVCGGDHLIGAYIVNH